MDILIKMDIYLYYIARQKRISRMETSNINKKIT